MVDVSATVEVNEGEQRGLGFNVTVRLCLLKLLGKVVVGVYVGVVVHFVVELHDLARDGGLEGAVVVYSGQISTLKEERNG